MSELLSRGTEIVEISKESTNGGNGRHKVSATTQIKNGNMKRSRIEDNSKNEWNCCSTIDDNYIEQQSHTQRQTNGSDQFDVFGYLFLIFSFIKLKIYKKFQILFF